MYLGDPREKQIDLDNHTIWEEDGRKEERYVWHGRVLDLCDLPPEEYAKTIFYVKEYEAGLIKNTLSTAIDGKNVVITFPYPPASDIVMIIRDNDGDEDSFIIPNGYMSPYTTTLANVDSRKVLTIFIGPTYETATSPSFSDYIYQYSVIKTVVPTDLVRYAYPRHIEVESGISEAKLLPTMVEGTVINNECKFAYQLQPVEYYGINDMPTEDINRILDEEQIDLIILSTTEVEKIYLNETDDQTSSWVKYGNITLSGIVYQIYRFVQYHLCNVYDSKYETPSVKELKYKITLQ